MSKEFTDRAKAAIDGVTDTARRIIALATGVLALEISFAHNLIGPHLSPSAVVVLRMSWIAWIGAVFAGIWTLQAINGLLCSPRIRTLRHFRVWKSSVQIPICLQMVLFVLGLLLTTGFGFETIGAAAPEAETVGCKGIVPTINVLQSR